MLGVTLDLGDSRAAIEELRRIARSDCPYLVFANAGITRMIGRDEEGESFGKAHDILAVNLEGALATIMRWLSVLPVPVTECIMRSLGVWWAPPHRSQFK